MAKKQRQKKQKTQEVEKHDFKIEISANDGRVKLEFESPVLYVSMGYIQALGLANIIIEKAREIASTKWIN